MMIMFGFILVALVIVISIMVRKTAVKKVIEKPNKLVTPIQSSCTTEIKEEEPTPNVIPYRLVNAHWSKAPQYGTKVLFAGSNSNPDAYNDPDFHPFEGDVDCCEYDCPKC